MFPEFFFCCLGAQRHPHCLSFCLSEWCNALDGSFV